MKIQNILIGSDPEVMLTRVSPTTGKEELYPSYLAKIPGTKKKPYPIGQDCFIQVDNVMAEFCVPPTDNPENMFKAIQHCISFTEKKFGVKVKPGSSGEYLSLYLNHPTGMRFGCESDFCAWNLSENPTPNCKNKNLRSAGQHLHVSYEKPNDKTSVELIKALDVFVGLPGILQDDDTQRRKLYGRAGSFRLKKYGVEYRTPGAYWIFTEELVKQIFSQVQEAVNFVNSGRVLSFEEGKLIQRAINSSNKELAVELITKYHEFVPTITSGEEVSV